MMPPGGAVNTTLPTVLSIIGFVFCCGPSSIVFGIAFVFAIQANNLLKSGDVAGAQAKARTAMVLDVVGFVGGAIVAGLYSFMRVMSLR